jgi:hypothetical protein
MNNIQAITAQEASHCHKRTLNQYDVSNSSYNIEVLLMDIINAPLL